MSRLLPRRSSVEEPEERGPRLVDIDEDAADEVFSALSSATARSILAALYEEPRTASDLATAADTSLQNVRYHLDKLDDAGLVEVVDEWYSERGTEMPVYAPTDDSLVVFAGGESGGSLRAALASLLGGVGVLGLASAVSHRLVRTFRPSWFGGSSVPPAGSGAPPDGAATTDAEVTTETVIEGTSETDAIATIEEATGAPEPSHGGVETPTAVQQTPTRDESTDKPTATAEESGESSTVDPEATPDQAPETADSHDRDAMATRTDSGTGSETSAESGSEATSAAVDDGDDDGGGNVQQQEQDGSGSSDEGSGDDSRGDGAGDDADTVDGGHKAKASEGDSDGTAVDGTTPDAGGSARRDTAAAADTTRNAGSGDAVTANGDAETTQAGTGDGGAGVDSSGNSDGPRTSRASESGGDGNGQQVQQQTTQRDPAAEDGDPTTDAGNTGDAADGDPSGPSTETAVDPTAMPTPTQTPATNATNATPTTTTPPVANTTTRTPTTATATTPPTTVTPVENTTTATNATTTTTVTPIGSTTDATNATNASVPPTSSVQGIMKTDALAGNARLRGSIEGFVTPETIGLAVATFGLLALWAWARRHRPTDEYSAGVGEHGGRRRGPRSHRALFLSVLLRLPAAVVASLLIVGIGLVVAVSAAELGIVASL